MENEKPGRFKWQMLEMPDGITTSNGNWYHITREEIEEYLPGLLKRYTLKRLIQEADTWVKSSDGFALMLYFVLVYTSVNPLLASLLSLVFYFLWYFNTSVFVNVISTPLAKILNRDGVVYTISAMLFIGMSLNEVIADYGILVEFNALWYGLILFFLFKVGLLRIGIQYMRSKYFNAAAVPKEDRILNMLLIRYGMKAGILPNKVQDMQDKLFDIANYHKERKK